MLKVSVVILAAGHGTRMRSDLPKVLHKIGGFPMLELVVSLATSLEDNNKDLTISDLVIVTSKELEANEDFHRILETYQGIKTIRQEYPLGTGQAVYTGLQALTAESDATLILYGDVPLLKITSLIKLIEEFQTKRFDLVGTAFQHKGNKPYGRFELDNKGQVKRVVEADELDNLNPMITDLCNAGMQIINSKILKTFLEEHCSNIDLDNYKKEFYLTRLFEKVESSFIQIDEEEAVGVNSKIELAAAEAIFQKNTRHSMMARGVTLKDPNSIYFSWDTAIAHDTVVEPQVIFGPGVEIGYCCEIKAFCYLEGVTVGERVTIGPFARIRPNSQIERGARIGNFVELKNAYLGPGTKAAHLTYLGDIHIGANSNVGAGVIICNYDGINKHQTIIGSEAQLGANSSIIAPRYIGDKAIVGAGSVITEDVPNNNLAISRARQFNKAKADDKPQ
jgi:bifunctional UDP-N-acetylglucosamine pyrophosphorylase/glucosamine-1-phosphate N-acetyltransferase